eukprot:TRINITY_DN8916_c0_g1_i6.p1 TRINITY_DN8916_c0_g1~~TRINITY_DN8916_c0_g1_i6.p1  ORF type:complete len:100 (-),score=1.39 TRINITY_DN8916_c0_g1_i6:1440-1739(-)
MREFVVNGAHTRTNGTKLSSLMGGAPKLALSKGQKIWGNQVCRQKRQCALTSIIGREGAPFDQLPCRRPPGKAPGVRGSVLCLLCHPGSGHFGHPGWSS